MVGLNDSRAVYIASSECCEPKRFVRYWNKVERKYIQEQQPNQFQPEHGSCQQNGTEHGQVQDWYPNEKMAVVPVCLNGRCCSSGVWVLYHINKDEGDDSLPILAFGEDVVNAIFLKYSKEGRLFSSHAGIRNIPSDVCYDDTKHYQVKSKHRRIQNPFKHLRWSVFV